MPETACARERLGACVHAQPGRERERDPGGLPADQGKAACRVIEGLADQGKRA